MPKMRLTRLPRRYFSASSKTWPELGMTPGFKSILWLFGGILDSFTLFLLLPGASRGESGFFFFWILGRFDGGSTGTWSVALALDPSGRSLAEGFDDLPLLLFAAGSTQAD